MRKYSVALLEPQGTFGNRQQLFAVDNLSGSTVKHSRRGCSPLRLQGVWRISTDVSSYYVNCKTGEITRE